MTSWSSDLSLNTHWTVRIKYITLCQVVNNYNAKESKKKLQFPLSANNETWSVSNARRFAQQKYHWYVLEVHSTQTSETNLHNSDSAICNCRPVDRANENAAGDKRTQLWDDSVSHIHHVDQRTYK